MIWLLIVAGGVAATPSSVLADAIGAYQQLDFRGAREALTGVLDDPDLSEPDRIRALAYLGRVHAVLGEPLRAQRRFEAVLALEVEYAVAWEESPRIREAFERAKKAMARKQAEKPAEHAEPAAAVEPVMPVEPPRLPKKLPRKKTPPRFRSSPKPTPRPPDPRPGPTTPPIEDGDGLTTWYVVGGAALAVTLGVIVTVVAVGAGGDDRVPTATWRLP